MKNWIISIFLLIIFIATQRFIQHVSLEQKASPKMNKAQEVAVLYHASGSFFAADNHLMYDLKSQQVREFSQKQGTFLTALHANSYAPDQQLTFTAEANEGKLSHDKKHLVLSGDVRLVQHPAGAPITLTGAKLNYNATTQVLSSEQSTRISDSNNEQISEHMRFNMRTRIVDTQGVTASFHAQTLSPTIQ